MSRTLPLEPGYFYHIYNRGNNRENLFLEEDNYQYFLDRYFHYLSPVVDTFAYCLLKNHFHLLIRVKTPSDLRGFPNFEELTGTNPSRQFSHFFNSYSKAINKRYGRTGHLFQERFRRKVVDSQNYLINTMAYIHRNPQKHGFVDDFRQYPFSSYHAFVDRNNPMLATDKALEWFQGLDGFTAFHDRPSNENGDFLIEDEEVG